MLLIAVSVFPVVLILLYIYYRDKYEKEPVGLLLKAFAGGVFSAVTALILVNPIHSILPEFSAAPSGSFYHAFFGAALPEESLKFLFLYLIIWKNRNFNENFDGIVYAVFVSLGFACLENILYVTNGGIHVGIMRGILSVPAHALFGIIMGYYFSIARFNHTSTVLNLSKSLFYAVAMHGIYDFLLFMYSGSADYSPSLSLLLILLFLIFVIFLWRLGFRKIRQHQETSVFKS